jgi:hypothetical protein
MLLLGGYGHGVDTHPEFSAWPGEEDILNLQI